MKKGASFMSIESVTSFSFISLSVVLMALLLLFIIPTIQSKTDHSSNSDYNRCAPFDCGNITFSFPFSSDDTFGSNHFECGLPRFRIACDPTNPVPPGLILSGRQYRVKDLYLTENLITVVDFQLINDLRSRSCGSFRNISISNITNNNIDAIVSLGFPALDNYSAFNFFQCSHELNLSTPVVGYYNCSEGYRMYLWDDERWYKAQLGPPKSSSLETPSGCKLMTLPVFGASLSRYGFLNRSRTENGSGGGGGDGGGGRSVDHRRMELSLDVLSDGFLLSWTTPNDCANCQLSGGRCGYDSSLGKIICFCKGGCDSPTHRSSRWKLIVGVVTGSTFVLLTAVFLLVFIYKKRAWKIFKKPNLGNKPTIEDEKNAKQFIKNYQSTLLTNYSYNDIKKMTNGFKEILGKGGYGNVFKGKFSDGRLVAVKMLENYRDNSHDFINEVTTIGRIHHVNIIHLLGFCWDGSKQALIYEYMPNGSLGDLLSKEELSSSLGLERLHDIAIAVAHGIEYLHNGCESRILHLDIKPQNILLDQNFDPKISDFGLAKVYSRDRSAVTMTGARGTIGYIAPEIFLRNLGNPSHKSDVYSFGMLLLEMVGGKNHLKPKAKKCT